MIHINANWASGKHRWFVILNDSVQQTRCEVNGFKLIKICSYSPKINLEGQKYGVAAGWQGDSLMFALVHLGLTAGGAVNAKPDWFMNVQGWGEFAVDSVCTAPKLKILRQRST